jgi:hypothetical protein
MFEKENAFYKAHIDEFRQKYLDKELVIIGDELVGVYDTLGNAYSETAKTHTPGTFCIKHVYEHPQLLRIPMYFAEGTLL